MPRLTEADALAVAFARLNSSEAVTSELGGEGRITDSNTPPYPCVRLIDPPGNDRFAQHLIAPIVQVEVLGDLDGTPGKHVLRRILYTVIDELVDIPNQPVGPGQPVVTSVTPSGGGGWSPEPNGQPRYIATLVMHVHPGAPVPVTP